jgi:tetratricopeptide (TPR) repeat protein
MKCSMNACAMLACALPLLIHAPTSVSQDHKGVCLGDGDNQERIKSCSAALETTKDPKLTSEYLFNRGTSYMKEGELDLAIRDLEEVVRLRPRGAGAMVNRGLAYQIRGEQRSGKASLEDFERAIRSFDAALKIDPKFALAHFHRGVTYYHMREFGQAVESYNAAIRIEPKNDTFRVSRCRAKIVSGQSGSAIADCSSAIKTSGVWRLTAYELRGYAHLNMKKPDSAVADFDRALGFHPSNDRALYGRGLAKIAKGDKSGGEDDIAKAKKLNRDVEKDQADYIAN